MEFVDKWIGQICSDTHKISCSDAFSPTLFLVCTCQFCSPLLQFFYMVGWR